MLATRLDSPGTLARSGPDSPSYQAARLAEVVDQLRQDFRGRDDLYRDIHAVLFGELPINIPEAYRKTAIEVRSPFAIHMTNTVAAALSINPYSIQFQPTGFGDAAEKNATAREHFFEASWERQESEADRSLFRLFMWSASVKGEGVLKTLERSKRAWGPYDVYSQKLLRALEKDPQYAGFDQHAKDHLFDARTEQYKLQLPYPIATTDVPPETFYYQKTEDGQSFAAEVKQVPYLETLDRYNAGFDSHGRVVSFDQVDPASVGLAREDWSRVMSKTRTLTMLECWDWQYCTYILIGPGQQASQSGNLGRGTVVKRVKHGYGDPFTKTLRGPYFHALGITTASRLPEYSGLSILFGFLRLFPLLDAMLTAEGNAAFLTGFPAFKRTTPAGYLPNQKSAFGQDGTEKEQEETIEPGTIYPDDIAPIEQPRSGPEKDKFIAHIREMIELALPSVVQGVVSSDQSGYALNQAAHLARLAWDPIVGNAQKALAARTGFESWLIENRIRETVYAWGEQTKGKRNKGGWLGIGPDDLQGVHRYKARLDPETPSNKIIEMRALNEMTQPGRELITYEDAVEKAGGNPDEVERSWMLKRLKASDMVQQKLMERIAQKLGTLEAKRVDAKGGMPNPEGGAPAGAGNVVFAPGAGMPIVPTPQGSVTGAGPGGVAGAPVTPGPPQAALPLPGQAP